MVLYNYKCNKCGYIFSRNVSINDRDKLVGSKCDKCKEGYIMRMYNIPDITFDMKNDCPSDLKLVINKMKDNAKLNSIVDEDLLNE